VERLLHEAAERRGRQVRRVADGAAAAAEHPQPQPARRRLQQLLHLAAAHGDGELHAAVQHGVGSVRAALPRQLDHVLGNVQQVVGHDYCFVPPTVMLETSTVGMPTPTGTLWPSLPQVQRPSDSFRSVPTIVTFESVSGPLPISVTLRTGAVTWPSSIRYASVTENTKSPLLMFTWPPP